MNSDKQTAKKNCKNKCPKQRSKNPAPENKAVKKDKTKAVKLVKAVNLKFTLSYPPIPIIIHINKKNITFLMFFKT